MASTRHSNKRTLPSLRRDQFCAPVLSKGKFVLVSPFFSSNCKAWSRLLPIFPCMVRLEDSFLHQPPTTPRPAARGRCTVQLRSSVCPPICSPPSPFIFPGSVFPTVSDGPNHTALRGSLLSPPLPDVKQIQTLKHMFLGSKQEFCQYLFYRNVEDPVASHKVSSLLSSGQFPLENLIMLSYHMIIYSIQKG